MLLKQGDILLIKTNKGFEEVLVIQNDIGNKHSTTTIVFNFVNNRLNVRIIDKKRVLRKIDRIDGNLKVQVFQKLISELNS
ncbi:mRNA-degrading endonuclease toxin of MazEF toxin-antitoxin module [Alkalibacillus filiformis]|uniref:mRNA-degrading endonuclease toxin of MazEF toxin-antitoxin module n=1 Tax=Alkalibacillus filiformis TaxID=200990 RepID=A0ABU0DPK6_9BACI|nr:hypothetical protein [Alkalibacillus filiformis]MDQ0350352.1 mRNA-degrading endonuclease toxin of MazEF toxin-antitoxin module [Alkalibacillus filiformis]